MKLVKKEYVKVLEWAFKIAYLFYCLLSCQKNGRSNALCGVGRRKPLSNNTKPTPVRVVRS